MANEFNSTVVTCVGILAEALSNKTVSKPMLDGFRLGLDGLTPEQIKIATNTALRTCKFMPSPAELRELAGEMKAEDAAIHAWEAFERWLSLTGGYKTLDMGEVINATVKSLGGLQYIIELDESDYKFLRQNFIKTFVTYQKTGVSKEAAQPMIGFYDSVNIGKGFAEQEPVRIGDVKPQKNIGKTQVELPRLKQA